MLRNIWRLAMVVALALFVSACGAGTSHQLPSPSVNRVAASANKHFEWAKRTPNAQHVYDRRYMRLLVNGGPYGVYPYYELRRRAGSSSHYYRPRTCRLVKRFRRNRFGRFYYYEKRCYMVRRGYVRAEGSGLIGRLMVRAARAIDPCKEKNSRRSYEKTTRLVRPIDGFAYETHRYKMRSGC